MQTRRFIAALLFSTLLLIGCRDATPPPEAPTPMPLAGVKLRVVVADDPAMAAAIGKLRDEWNVQTGSRFEIAETTEKELLVGKELPSDVVVCATHLLGPLAERKLLAPVPMDLSPEEKGPWSETFDLLRLREATWNGKTLAVPMGSPVFCCYYRADLLEKLHRQPPRTWAEYAELSVLLKSEKLQGAIEPLGPGWAGLDLLARAAPYAKHPDNYSALFDIETMDPLVDGPPFIRALEELAAAAKLGPKEAVTFDPAAVRTAFWEGRCGLALTWPSAAKTSNVLKPADGVRVGFSELPGSEEVYNVGKHAWERRRGGSENHESTEPQVPLLEIAGRIGVVRAGFDRPEAAFRLLLWLTDAERGARVCASSPETTLFRRTQAATAHDWVEKPVPASTAAAYASITSAALRRHDSVLALPLPGREEYLTALDEAVRSSAFDNMKPADALKHAADRWREITRRLGVESQKAAYLHSLGLD